MIRSNPSYQELQMNLGRMKRRLRIIMLKETQQPNVIKDTYRGRLNASTGVNSNGRNWKIT
jgi:glucosamine--fructose-6-phosphate aminotransferase (isomerizing)